MTIVILINIRPEVCKSIIKRTLAQVFPCEFCKIFKNTIFIEHLQTTASALNQIDCLEFPSFGYA